MKQRMRHWLENIPLTDPVERRQASVLQFVLIGWIILAMIDQVVTYIPFLFPSIGSYAAPPGPLPPIFLLILSLLFVAGALLWLSPVTALILLRRGRFKLAVSVATLGLLLAHSIATFSLGVTNGAVLVVFQIPIALAGL